MECPNCKSQSIVKNGSIYNGKQKPVLSLPKYMRVSVVVDNSLKIPTIN